jgi:uncharacterized membrane protein (UPF0127 family)
MIQNTTKKSTLAVKETYCSTILSKTRGLMFRKSAKPLIFVFDKEKKISLHMFFVFFPIDVLWLDKSRKVVQLKENFRPFSNCAAKYPAQYIIELPAGRIHTTKTNLGDTISFK